MSGIIYLIKKEVMKMKESFIVDVLKSFFGMEIANQVVYGDDKIIVELTDGNKARITAKK